jgi:hypothetical protein
VHYMFHSIGALLGAVIGFFAFSYHYSCETASSGIQSIPLERCENILGGEAMEWEGPITVGALVGLAAGAIFGGWLGEELD